ncbi:unnamed protein product [Closterium sp. NIES-54]
MTDLVKSTSGCRLGWSTSTYNFQSILFEEVDADLAVSGSTRLLGRRGSAEDWEGRPGGSGKADLGVIARKRLADHLAAPSPPSASAPTHSDLLACMHVANARICQVILACLPPTLLPQFSHIRYAKDLFGYLNERFHSQTPINVIAVICKLTSLRLGDFTTMADYIARVQALSSKLAAKNCPPTAAVVSPPSAPSPLLATTAAAASSRPCNTFPPYTYIIRQGPRKGQPCSCTNHPTSSCFQKLQMTSSWVATLVTIPTGSNSLVGIVMSCYHLHSRLPASHHMFVSCMRS